MTTTNKKTQITIKPYRPVQMDPHYADNTWKLLKHAIHEIHKKNASGLSFEELYRNAYNMVLHKYGDKLYNGLREVVYEHLRGVALRISTCNDENFLEELNVAWKDHKISMLMIRDILMYMDRVYVVQQSEMPVYDLGLELFRETVASAPGIKERLLDTLLELIHKERIGEAINRSLIKSVTQMLVDLGVNSRSVYEEDFERPFLEATATFYRVESQEFIASNSCPDYMRKVESRRQEELDRVRHYLDSCSEHKVKEVVERELITNHMRTLIEMEGSGLVPMLRDGKIEDLARMYSLFSKVKGQDMIKDQLSAYIRECGRRVVQDEERMKDPGTYVQALLDIKEKYDRLLALAFMGDKTFQHAINQAFEHFINLNPKSPEFISLFIDEKLKRGAKEQTEEEMDTLLDKVMTLFRFIQEKDVFEKYYKQHLAKRLLLGKSVSEDTERNMIEKLKTECGYQFTSKLEGMFKDIRLSANTMDDFRLYLSTHPKLSLEGVDLSVQILTTGFWPTQTSSSCRLPAEALRCCDIFRDYYLSKHSGRRLTFQTNMGTAELRGTFGNKRHEIIVSTQQMCILMLFNNADIYTYKEIAELSQIPPNDLKRNLLSLCCGKFHVLTKEIKTKKIEDTDRFMFNKAFKCRLYRFKIQALAAKETDKQRAMTRVKVDEDRKHQIEACIVRIMKSRKTMQHASLVSEVCQHLAPRFRPNPLVIKKRIESLIERDYLERTAADRKMYSYLA